MEILAFVRESFYTDHQNSAIEHLRYARRAAAVVAGPLAKPNEVSSRGGSSQPRGRDKPPRNFHALTAGRQTQVGVEWTALPEDSRTS